MLRVASVLIIWAIIGSASVSRGLGRPDLSVLSRQARHHPSPPPDPVDSGSGSGREILKNLTVPLLLQEVYMNISRTNRTNRPRYYGESNSVTSFENIAGGNDICHPLRFVLPPPGPGVRFLNSEVHIRHQVPPKVLRRMSSEEKNKLFRVQLCVRRGSFCSSVGQVVKITPQFSGWLTFLFSPNFFIEHWSTTIALELNVVFGGRALDCGKWPLDFTLDDSNGFNSQPLYTVYAHKSRDTVFRTFMAEVARTNPLLISGDGDLKGGKAEEDDHSGSGSGSGGGGRRKKRTTCGGSSTPRSFSNEELSRRTNSCAKHTLRISQMWRLEVIHEKRIATSLNINYCEGQCLSKLADHSPSERVSLVRMAKRSERMSIQTYQEVCIPTNFSDINIVFVHDRGGIELLTIPDLEVTDCGCFI